MKKINILYWTFTGLFCAFMLTSAIPNLLAAPEWVDIMTQLGYPKYLLPFLGIAKLLGMLALLVPGFPKIREWAYAGFFFDLIGAIYSAVASGPFNPLIFTMAIPFLLLGLSYGFNQKRELEGG